MGKTLIMVFAMALSLAWSLPAFAEVRGEIRHDVREIRHDRRELRQDKRELRRYIKARVSMKGIHHGRKAIFVDWRKLRHNKHEYRNDCRNFRSNAWRRRHH